jgi:hypothetical protein
MINADFFAAERSGLSSSDRHTVEWIDERARLLRIQSKADKYPAHVEEQGEPIHCLIKFEIGAGHGLSELLEQEAGDLVLFSVNPGPHRRISHSSIFEVDEKRLRELGPVTDFHRVGNTEIYFYSS